MTMKQRISILKSSGNLSLLGTWNSSVSLTSITCNLNPGHQRVGPRVGQLSVELNKKVMKNQIAWTWYSNCLVSQNSLEVFRNASLTGFDIQSVEITQKGSIVDHSFSELLVTGWGGVAPEACGVKLLESCPACGLLRYSAVTDWNHLIDLDAWDGSSIFMVWPLPKYIFLTEKAAEIIKILGGDSTDVIPIGDLEPQKGELSPGRLGNWLSEHRIEELNVDQTIR